MPARSLIDDAFGHWLAGFIDGEGSFGIVPSSERALRCDFAIGLRADDEPILREIQARTGLGRIYNVAARDPRWGAQVFWCVRAKKECVELAAILDRYPLRAKKATDYAIWREAVSCWTRYGRGRTGSYVRIHQLRELLLASRRFHGSVSSPDLESERQLSLVDSGD